MLKLKRIYQFGIQQGNKSTILRQIWQTRWAIVSIVLLYYLVYWFPKDSMEGLIAYKLLIGSCAYFVAHLLVKSAYDYASISALLAKDKFNELPDSVKFLGVCLLRALPESAFTIGAMLSI